MSATIGGGSAAYLTSLAREEYLSQGGESPGQYHETKATLTLGLYGVVGAQEAKNICQHRTPDGTGFLGQRQRYVKGRKARSGWDISVDPDKTVSLAWALMPKLRDSVSQAHEKAVDAVCASILAMMRCRTGSAGSGKTIKAEPVLMKFLHGTSRAQDPQLHTHILIAPKAYCEDGKWRAVPERVLYRAQSQLNQVYLSALRPELEALGFRTVDTEFGFALEGFSKGLRESFSKRRQQILRAIERNPDDVSAKVKQMICLSTRQAKRHIALKDLFPIWSAHAKRLGFKPELVLKGHRQDAVQQPERNSLEPHLLTNPTKPTMSIATNNRRDSALRLPAENRLVNAKHRAEHGLKRHEKAIQRAVTQITGELSQHMSAFSSAFVLEKVQSALRGSKVPSALTDLAAPSYLAESPRFVELRGGKYPLYTTAALYKAEKRLIKLLSHSRSQTSNRIRSVEPILSRRASRVLTEEQKRAVRHITTAPGSILCLTAKAGSDPEAVIATAATAWQSKGFQVVGASGTRFAARELEQTALRPSPRKAIPAKVLHELFRGTFLHSASLAALRNRERVVMPRSLTVSGLLFLTKRERRRLVDARKQTLNAKSVLVVTDANRLSTSTLHKLALSARRAKARLVLIGDPDREKLFGEGAPFKRFAVALKSPVLAEPTRITDRSESNSIALVQKGDFERALSRFKSEGQLTIAATDDQASEALIASWLRDRTRALSDTQILAHRTRVTELNQLCQKRRLAASELRATQSVRWRGRTFYKGDRVVFNAGHRARRIKAGDTGLIVNVRSVAGIRTARVRLDRRPMDVLGLPTPPVLVDFQNRNHLELGYARSVGQSLVAPSKTFVLADPRMDAQAVRTLLSSHREEVNVFASAQSCGEDAEVFTRSSARKRENHLAHDVEDHAAKKVRDSHVRRI